MVSQSRTQLRKQHPMAGCVLVSMGEDDAHERAMKKGAQPWGEYFVLRRVFEETIAMRQVAKHAMGSIVGQALFGARTAWQLARRPDLKLVYMAEELPGIFVLAGLTALGSRAKKVMLIHNVGSRRRTIPLATLGLAKKLDRVLCLSESSKQVLIDRYHVDPEKIVVLGSRVDDVFFAVAPATIPKERPLVVSAGAINRDYETLVDACRDLDVDVKIAADTAWRYSIGKRVRGVRRALSHPRLEMRSWGSYDKLRDLYAAADVVVVPLHDAEYASGQTVILEAMAMGKPVVTTDIRGKSDFIEDGETGIYVKPADPAALRAAIERVLQAPSAARAMGRKAAAAVRERFTVEHYADRILDACRAALAEDDEPAPAAAPAPFRQRARRVVA
jgi:glycosyltransferase involved in cell wall biosynthesis